MKRPLLAATLAAAPLFAHAHHFMDDALPQTIWQGFLSGLGHPVIGLDHAAFIVAAGLLLARLAPGLWGVAALVAGALLGALAHLGGLDLPGGELGIALSVVLAGTLILGRPAVKPAWLMAGLAVAGALHGYAYAESIIGAEPSPLVAYLAGFSIVQFAIAAAVLLLHRQVSRERWAPAAANAFGLGALAVGVVFLGAQLA